MPGPESELMVTVTDTSVRTDGDRDQGFPELSCAAARNPSVLCAQALGIFLSSMPVSSRFTDKEGEACVSQSR